MAHKRKKRRTQGPNQPTNSKALGINKTASGARIPKSMVIRLGGSDVGSSVSQLVKDMRAVMEPHTASKLRERRSNKLRDYTTMAGPLGVTHLMLFSRSQGGHTNMRLAITPRGPTFSFRVEKYSLARDVANSQKRPKTVSKGVEHVTPPLLVMNNFSSHTTEENGSDVPRVPKHLETLATSVFQSLFPPISPQRTPLSTIRRVLLVNRETSAKDGSYVLSLRHYHISTKPLVAVSRGIKRLRQAEAHATSRAQKKQAKDYDANGKQTSDSEAGSQDGDVMVRKKVRKATKGGLPDMSRLDDIADFVLDPSGAGYTSASDTEAETDAEVEVAEVQTRKVLSKRERQRQLMAMDAGAQPKRSTKVASKIQRRAVKLSEIGPRMKLRLVKVEEGLCTGKVMWHEFVEKTDREVRQMNSEWEKRRREIDERKRIQRENVEKKKATQKSSKKADEQADKEAEDELDGELEDEDWDEYDDDLLNDDIEPVVRVPRAEAGGGGDGEDENADMDVDDESLSDDESGSGDELEDDDGENDDDDDDEEIEVD